jgi:hypothetical protein
VYYTKNNNHEGRLSVDWESVKAEYIAGGTSYRKLAEKYNVTLAVLRSVAQREGWVKLRTQTEHKANTEIVRSVGKKKAKKTVDKLKRVSDLTDKLLDKIEQAIEELDIQLYKHVVKEKVIEYNNELRPDKPTKETIHEDEKVIEVKTIVDRSGLKAIASSLRDIKEIQMLKSELDEQEQEARIDKLRREAMRDADNTSDIEVVFDAGPGEWNG